MGQCASTQKQTRWHICKKFHRRWPFCLELNQNLVEQVVASGSVEHGDGGAGVRGADPHGGGQVSRGVRHSARQAQGGPGDSGDGRKEANNDQIVFQITTPKEELMSWQTRVFETAKKKASLNFSSLGLMRSYKR